MRRCGTPGPGAKSRCRRETRPPRFRAGTGPARAPWHRRRRGARPPPAHARRTAGARSSQGVRRQVARGIYSRVHGPRPVSYPRCRHPTMRILLVEDDAVLSDLMVRSLTAAGHRVDLATNLEDAAHWWRVQAFDVVLLDLNLPHSAHERSGLGSGLSILRAARARGDRTPVLVLTARDR